MRNVHPVLQMEATECGAASLAMILDFYGKTVTLEQLRQECSVSRDGVSAKNIIRAAQFHNLTANPLRVNIEGAKSLNFPAIIHWNMDHFLVLCGFDKKGARIADPAFGLRTVSMEEFSRSFTGIAIEFTPTADFKRDTKEEDEKSYIFSCVKPFLPSVFYFIILELCALIGSIAVMLLNSVFIDRIIIESNIDNLKIVIRVLLCAGVISAASAAVNENIRYKFGKKLNAVINFGFTDRFFKLPIEFYAQRSEGDLVNRQSSAMLMGDRIMRFISPIPGYILQIIVYLALILVFNLHIAIIGILSAAANIAALIISAKSYEEKMRASSRDAGALQSKISQAADMIETIKSCGAEDVVFESLAAAGAQSINIKTELDKTSVYYGSFFSFLNSLGSAVVLIWGIWEILSGSMSTGVLIALQALASAMLLPVGNMVNTGLEIQELMGKVVRTNDVMNYKKDNKFLTENENTKQENDIDIDGDIVLKNVSFGYNPIDEPFIKDFNLTIKKGCRIALAGGSGSGKSTVVKIIAGLYRENGGAVTYNGLLRNEINQHCFYSKIASVSQNIRLFEGTVIENITMWDDTVEYEEVVKAAKAACIHDDIISRGNGYKETVTENGANFSGGQRQRIEIARALLKKPSVIILDEATSALDSDTEARIMNNIKALGITLIVAAHRLSAIEDSDEIIVMENGAVKERGTHNELMNRHGAYFELVRSAADE